MPGGYNARMQVFTFRSERDGEVTGFTDQRFGGNLPSTFSPWKPIGPLDVQNGDALAGVPGGGNAVLGGIRRTGFFLSRS
jgi:hypothetical protein